MVDAVGDLTDKPLLLDAPLDELAGVAFGPQGIGNPFETGRFVARWQSLVTGIPHPDERVHVGLTGRDRGLPSVWRLIYRPSGFLSVADASGERPLPVPFTPGRADQFEIAFDLDTDTYAFSVNGAAPFVGSLDAPGHFAHIIFRSLGRFGFEPVGLALDNVTLVRVPEPAGLGCLAVAGAALMGRRARRRR